MSKSVVVVFDFITGTVTPPTVVVIARPWAGAEKRAAE